MTLLPETLRTIPVINLAIPGSHDSMSYSIVRGAAVAPDSERIIGKVNCILPCVVRRWARTQSLTTAQQLRAGIRYFDLRISMHAKDRRFYFVHGLYGEPIENPLTEIRQFVTEHPDEFVVLDCQHFYAFDGEADYDRLANELRSMFGVRLFGPGDGRLAALTLALAQKTGKQVRELAHECIFTQE